MGRFGVEVGAGVDVFGCCCLNWGQLVVGREQTPSCLGLGG